MDILDDIEFQVSDGNDVIDSETLRTVNSDGGLGMFF